MNGARRRAVVVLSGMVAAAALAKAGVPTKKIADTWETDLEKIFPVQFGDWQVDRSIPVILPAPDVQAKLDAIYNQVLARTYVNRRTGTRVMLSVAYGGDQSDGMSVHLPEVCYPAQGFQLLGQRSATLKLLGRDIPVKQLRTRLGSRVEPVTYWLTLGETVAATRTQRKLRQMEYGLRGIVPDGMLVRVSSIDADAERAFGIQQAFLEGLASAVPSQYANRVLGTVSA
ncbi:MAG: EpsI family protein [Rubrivivax sp.]|nr:EpsI family protein [Rubrivivax sp.]